MGRNYKNKTRFASPPPPAPKSFAWREHPLAIAAGTAAATFVLSMGYFTQVALPTQTARLEIALLKEKDATASASSKLVSAETKLRSANEAISKVQRELKAAQIEAGALHKALKAANTKNFLALGIPYPIGLGVARIGMTEQRVREIYAGSEIKKEELGYLSVTIKDSPIETATYYLDDDTNLVSHISFNTSYQNQAELPDDFLLKRLTEALGAPAANPRPGYYRWAVLGVWNVFLMDDRSYTVMKAEDVLAIWPDEKPKAAVRTRKPK